MDEVKGVILIALFIGLSILSIIYNFILFPFRVFWIWLTNDLSFMGAIKYLLKGGRIDANPS